MAANFDAVQLGSMIGTAVFGYVFHAVSATKWFKTAEKDVVKVLESAPAQAVVSQVPTAVASLDPALVTELINALNSVSSKLDSVKGA